MQVAIKMCSTALLTHNCLKFYDEIVRCIKRALFFLTNELGHLFFFQTFLISHDIVNASND